MAMKTLLKNAALSVAALALGAAAAPAQDALAIVGGKIIPVKGAPIEGGVILIRGGKIEAVGKDLTVPVDAKVIDAKGKVVAPGFIEAHTSRGMDQTNENNPNVPFLSVLDAVDPSQDFFDECRRNGVTTVAVVPGNNTMLGGQAAVVKSAGSYVDEMVVKRNLGIKLSLRPTSDRSRMSHLAAIRKELDAARDALKEEEAKAKEAAAKKEEPAKESEKKSAEEEFQPRPRRGQGGGRPGGQPSAAGVDPALAKEALGKLLKGELIAFIYCEQALDVPQALKLIKEYGLKAALVLGQDCHKAAKLVAESKLPVTLDPTLVYWETDPRTGEDRQIVLPKLWREAGVPVTFQTTGFASGNLFRAPNLPPTVGTNYLWFQAATAAKHGLPKDEALAAITLRPAQLLGVDKLVGTIEPGKEADLVILSGEPLKLDTWVEKTLVRGKVVYDKTQDAKLKSLLSVEKQ